uniref:Uncharacterized protein n=1 Tax=viral metagenome TaxID=1070528 RepID=A0A6C0BNF0_9ZZZZ
MGSAASVSTTALYVPLPFYFNTNPEPLPGFPVYMFIPDNVQVNVNVTLREPEDLLRCPSP